MAFAGFTIERLNELESVTEHLSNMDPGVDIERLKRGSSPKIKKILDSCYKAAVVQKELKILLLKEGILDVLKIRGKIYLNSDNVGSK